MKKSKKLLVGVLFMVLVLVAGVGGFVLNQKNINSDQKEFTVTVVSERDDFEKTYECDSSYEFLGEYMREADYCTWEDSEYGIYITGLCGYDQDLDNQYWWAIYIDNEQSSNGADLIPLEEGRDYEFVLTQGW